MRRAFDFVRPCWVARLAVKTCVGREFAILQGILSDFICPSNKFGLGCFQSAGQFVPLVHQLGELLALRCDPDASDCVAKDLPQSFLVLVGLGNRHEQDSPGRDPGSVGWGVEVGLAQVCIVEAFTSNNVEHESYLGIRTALLRLDMNTY